MPYGPTLQIHKTDNAESALNIGAHSQLIPFMIGPVKRYEGCCSNNFDFESLLQQSRGKTSGL